MEILLSALCDSAADYRGKLCILGTFDTIYAPKFPCQHHHCAVALRILFRDEDIGKHSLKVSLIEPDGKNILPGGGIKISVDVAKIPEKTFFLSRNFVFNLNGLPLPKTAQYSFDVTYDDVIVARMPLQVLETPEKGKKV